jgi:hypothetical protein
MWSQLAIEESDEESDDVFFDKCGGHAASAILRDDTALGRNRSTPSFLIIHCRNCAHPRHFLSRKGKHVGRKRMSTRSGGLRTIFSQVLGKVGRTLVRIAFPQCLMLTTASLRGGILCKKYYLSDHMTLLAQLPSGPNFIVRIGWYHDS